LNYFDVKTGGFDSYSDFGQDFWATLDSGLFTSLNGMKWSSWWIGRLRTYQGSFGIAELSTGPQCAALLLWLRLYFAFFRNMKSNK
jgi:hypothetical protein